MRDRAMREQKRNAVRERALRERKVEVMQRGQRRLETRQIDSSAQAMAREFACHFPDMVDNYKLKYPLPDDLLKLQPKLHGVLLSHKPQAHKVKMAPRDFERLLVIWDFFVTFREFLKTPAFKLEELEAGLRWQKGQNDQCESVGLI